MLNYHNLNDVEFEDLCKDIMEKILNTKLRVFAKGRDGGIDITDNTTTHNIVVQVKHYINSTFSDLRTSLRKEIPKVTELSPNEFYVCCGKTLTSNNIEEIYTMFSDYMESDNNILTLKEIDDFLSLPQNADIFRKHYKLWLYSSNILSDIFNQDIFIDCESLLYGIENESKFFVQTSSYDICLKCLESNRIVMLLGNPGVGKTMTSKMLALFWASQGYRVRYNTNGDISDIKRSLSGNRECKEIIFLDDCLGQHYFNMKSTQENELISLIKYIKTTPNKMLILNSRITIYNEAQERSEEFKIFILGDTTKIHTINMDRISSLEKARIFYNHLVFRDIPQEYYKDIRKNRRYLEIVNHPNYTPRIIDYITQKRLYLSVATDAYTKFILATLSQPNDIWKNEFDYRLKDVDRAFMSTLYSLTDTTVDCNILKECYHKRLSNLSRIDPTVDTFDLVLKRLSNSLVKIVDNRGTMQIGVINPSVNDYLKLVFSNNILELTEVRKSIQHFAQYERCYAKEQQENAFRQMLIEGNLKTTTFRSNEEKLHVISSKICQYEIANKAYTDIVLDFLMTPYEGVPTLTDILLAKKNGKQIILGLCTKFTILRFLLEEPFYSCYELFGFLQNKANVINILESVELKELVEITSLIYCTLQNTRVQHNMLEWMVKESSKIIQNAIDKYANYVDTSAYVEDYDISDLVKNHHHQYYIGDGDYDMDFDMSGATEELETWVVTDVKDDLRDIISVLPDCLKSKFDIEEIYINTDSSDIKGIIESYLEPSIDDDNDFGHSSSPTDSSDVIDFIFDRDI